MGTNALLPGRSLPGQALPGFNIPGPLIPPAAPVATISTPLAPPGQQLTNFATLINGQVDLVGVMLFIRFPNPTQAPLPGQALPGQMMPGFVPIVTQPKAVLLVENVDYTRNGGIISMTQSPPVGSVMTAQIFTKGLQLGGATAKRYVSPVTLAVTGPYDGVSLSYGITFGPTIMGGVDGVNNLLTWTVAFQRVQIWRNGLLQTFGVDVVAGPTAIVFLPGAIPQPGDIITALGYNNC